MNIRIAEKTLDKIPLLRNLIELLRSIEDECNLNDSELYVDFPIYETYDENIIVAQVMIISKYHGIILIKSSTEKTIESFNTELEEDITPFFDSLYSSLFSKSLRKKIFRRDRSTLNFNISSLVYAPLLQAIEKYKEIKVFRNEKELLQILKSENDTDEQIFKELVSFIEGTDGLKKKLNHNEKKDTRKGAAAYKLEQEILSFDQFQKLAFTTDITGIKRIRGLAGSGKTVVLAIKAALTHLKYPNAKIAYTFYTKSLYQHIKNLIEKFYRQFNDKEPNWENLLILHAWGGSYNHGIYYLATQVNDTEYFNFGQAKQLGQSPFREVCIRFLLNVPSPEKQFDYMFIDEGQDFPHEFINLCLKITQNERIVWAYDEMQTIFQIETPKSEDIFDRDSAGNPIAEILDDVILYKCYRNPREVLVVAHSLAFGIYGDRIVQMIRSPEYWHDIGYTHKHEAFKKNDEISIMRPLENSLKSISEEFSIDEIIRCEVFSESIEEEVDFVCKSINEDIENGLYAHDILVITVDDRHTKSYLSLIQQKLAKDYSIQSNNTHADKFSIGDFTMPNYVTLSTVHKAKGNEALSVYIVGVDSLFSLLTSAKDRNILFTAMTRTKGWATITGLGDAAQKCKTEIEIAKNNFPYLKFSYPSEKDLRIMERDLKDAAIRKSKAKKMMDELLRDYTATEIKELIEDRKKVTT